MKSLDKLFSAYSKANPFVKFLSVAGVVSGAMTLCTDIGNIISTSLSEPPPLYEYPEIKSNNLAKNNMFQTNL